MSASTYAAIVIVSMIFLFVVCFFLSLYIRRLGMQRKLSKQEKQELIEASEVRESEIEKPSYDDKPKN